MAVRRHGGARPESLTLLVAEHSVDLDVRDEANCVAATMAIGFNC